MLGIRVRSFIIRCEVKVQTRLWIHLVQPRYHPILRVQHEEIYNRQLVGEVSSLIGY